jgi:DNA-binding response OmpR family regulator
MIDDDAELCELVARFLGAQGFAVDCAGDGGRGVALACAHSYGLILLDVMLPDVDGFEVLRRIRERSRTPVLMLTARGETTDRVTGLELGADDYLPKPYDPAELAARIRAILRRAERRQTQRGFDVLSVDDIQLNAASRGVHRSGLPIVLTAAEFDLLEILMRAAGTVVRRDDLVRAVLGRELSPYDRSLDTHISNLRRKLGRTSDGFERIKSIRGTGYLYAKSVS